MTKLKLATTAALLATGMLVLPALARSDSAGTQGNPAKECKTLRATLGAGTFKLTYGTNHNRSNAFGKCVSKQAKADAAARSNAAKDCKAEQAADRVAFENKYGTNPTKSNAYGKCVSQKAKQNRAEHQDDIVNAAKKCKAERATDPAAFKLKYGTNANRSNAFGKCVSKLASSK